MGLFFDKRKIPQRWRYGATDPKGIACVAAPKIICRKESASAGFKLTPLNETRVGKPAPRLTVNLLPLIWYVPDAGIFSAISCPPPNPKAPYSNRTEHWFITSNGGNSSTTGVALVEARKTSDLPAYFEQADFDLFVVDSTTIVKHLPGNGDGYLFRYHLWYHTVSAAGEVKSMILAVPEIPIPLMRFVSTTGWPDLFGSKCISQS